MGGLEPPPVFIRHANEHPMHRHRTAPNVQLGAPVYGLAPDRSSLAQLALEGIKMAISSLPVQNSFLTLCLGARLWVPLQA